MLLLHMQTNLATECTIFARNGCDFNYLSVLLQYVSMYIIENISNLKKWLCFLNLALEIIVIIQMNIDNP